MAEASPPATPLDHPPPDDRYPGEGCVSLWLKFLIGINVLVVVLTPWYLDSDDVRAVVPDFQRWMILPYVLGGVLNVVFLGALLGRRMWGYVGLWAVALTAGAINIAAGMQVAKAVSSLIGLVVLYWVLQIGGERSGWSRLK